MNFYQFFNIWIEYNPYCYIDRLLIDLKIIDVKPYLHFGNVTYLKNVSHQLKKMVFTSPKITF